MRRPTKPKTHCRHGHALTPENTRTNPHGRRECRACTAAAARRKRVRDRLAREAIKGLFVKYDARDDCWRIYILDPQVGGESGDPQQSIAVWPVRWLSFASEGAARIYLDRHAEQLAA